MAITITDGLVEVDGLRLTDPAIIDVLERYPVEERKAVFEQMASVGARGMRSMGLSVGLDDIDSRLRRSVAAAAASAQRDIETTLQKVGDLARQHLDPHHPESPAGQTLRELDGFRRQLMEGLDPARADTPPGRLLELLEEAVGVDGSLEQRLRALLDPHGEGSAVDALATVLTTRMSEIRDLVTEDRGRRTEAERGTQKGVAFEDTLDSCLRTAAGPHDWWVERTSSSSGSLHAESKVGDFVVHVTADRSVVIEAKNTARIALTGPGGILAELDAAMVNRDADIAICVSARDAFPGEVGQFAVYGDRILVVDDGDGIMLEVALRWARLALDLKSNRAGRIDFDADLIADRLQRLKNLTKRFSHAKRSLSQIASSVDEVRGSLDETRADVIELLGDLETHLLGPQRGTVHPLRPVGSG